MSLFGKKNQPAKSEAKMEEKEVKKNEEKKEKLNREKERTPRKEPEIKYFGSRNQPLYLLIIIIILGLILKFLAGE